MKQNKSESTVGTGIHAARIQQKLNQMAEQNPQTQVLFDEIETTQNPMTIEGDYSEQQKPLDINKTDAIQYFS